MTAMTATGNLNIVFCFPPHAKAVGSSREVRKNGLRVLVPVPGLHFQWCLPNLLTNIHVPFFGSARNGNFKNERGPPDFDRSPVFLNMITKFDTKPRPRVKLWNRQSNHAHLTLESVYIVQFIIHSSSIFIYHSSSSSQFITLTLENLLVLRRKLIKFYRLVASYLRWW